MASPQKENGYTPICNELLEVIYGSQFTATQLKILLVICRYTYGFSRKNHSLSERFISTAVSVSKRNIRTELNKLIEKNVIKVVSPYTATSPRVLALNKHYDQWEWRYLGKEMHISPGDVAIPTEGMQISSLGGDVAIPQDNQGLKTNNKTNVQEEFFETIWSLYPNKKGKASVSKKAKDALYKMGIDEVTRCLSRYKAAKEEWRAWQNGSTFFTSGYVDYLDKNYSEVDVKPSIHIQYKSAREKLFGENA